jgi:hypothetical protein
MTVQMHPYRPQLLLLLFGPRSCRWRSVASGALFTHASWLAGLMASFMRCIFSFPSSYSKYFASEQRPGLIKNGLQLLGVGKREDETLRHYDEYVLFSLWILTHPPTHRGSAAPDAKLAFASRFMSSRCLLFLVSNLTIWVFSYAAALQGPQISLPQPRLIARKADLT